MLALLMGVSLTACGRESVETPGSKLENGVAAIDDAMTTKPSENRSTPTEPIDELRDGSSADTVATPDDFPAAYNYGSGKISDYSRTAMLQKMPEPAENDTVLNTAADPTNIQALYLWEESNLPPTFYVYGTEDPFYRQFQQQYDVISGMGIPTGRIVLNGRPYGFGSDGGWVKNYAAWLETVFAESNQ